MRFVLIRPWGMVFVNLGVESIGNGSVETLGRALFLGRRAGGLALL
jgi:hypothetical protein